jgi:hypothetical protein
MVTVIVTVHGIGFQVPANDEQGIAGYADPLHDHLRAALGDSLGDDPQRGPGVRGPVYVHSQWPPGSRKIEEGIERLGRWEPGQRPGRVDPQGKPLVDGNQPIAHIALVYANLEEKTSALGPLGVITEMSVFRLAKYVGVPGLGRMLTRDALGLLAGRECPHVGSSLQPRKIVRRTPQPSPDERTIDIEPDPTGLWATLRQLENDVASYVTRDMLRQRVRSFVTECLMRLAHRPDVDGIVVNAHSQGTVVAFDVLRDFPVTSTDAIKAFVTSGSPLRKYVDLFAWGRDVGCLYGINHGQGRWTNFWDPRDPVADPLGASTGWRPGGPARPAPPTQGLFRAVDRESGQVSPDFSITDHQVNNLTDSCGRGLQAHNYWDNTVQFVPIFAEIVRSAASG